MDSKWKIFIARITEGPDEDGDFEAIFFKRSMNNGFLYAEIKDLAWIELADVIKILPKAMSTATTKRSAGVINFDVEVSAFGVYGV